MSETRTHALAYGAYSALRKVLLRVQPTILKLTQMSNDGHWLDRRLPHTPESHNLCRMQAMFIIAMYDTQAEIIFDNRWYLIGAKKKLCSKATY